VFGYVNADVLEALLRRGLSLEAIGELSARHPSTVAYWVKRHGLAAVSRDRHAPRGGVDRETLEALVGEGLTTREIGSRLSLSQSTVRYWLRRHGLKTQRTRHRSTTATRGVDSRRKLMDCPKHGTTEFWIEARGFYRCLRCRAEAVARRRRRLKKMLVAEAGGRCRICGYDRYMGALQFHHRDGNGKAFGLAEGGLTRSLEALRGEAAKCVLLCANCHSEVEAGIVKIA